MEGARRVGRTQGERRRPPSGPARRPGGSCARPFAPASLPRSLRLTARVRARLAGRPLAPGRGPSAARLCPSGRARPAEPAAQQKPSGPRSARVAASESGLTRPGPKGAAGSCGPGEGPLTAARSRTWHLRCGWKYGTQGQQADEGTPAEPLVGNTHISQPAGISLSGPFSKSAEERQTWAGEQRRVPLNTQWPRDFVKLQTEVQKAVRLLPVLAPLPVRYSQIQESAEPLPVGAGALTGRRTGTKIRNLRAGSGLGVIPGGDRS